MEVKMGKHIPLGKASPGSGLAEADEPKTLEEKVDVLSHQVEELGRMIHTIQTYMFKEMLAPPVPNENAQAPQMPVHVNKDGLEIGMSLLGPTSFGWFHTLMVAPDGYYLGNDCFQSLSAAATAAVGYKKNGWEYWTVPNGQTVKEALGK
jgi:hypothetical protein